MAMHMSQYCITNISVASDGNFTGANYIYNKKNLQIILHHYTIEDKNKNAGLKRTYQQKQMKRRQHKLLT